MLKSFRLRLALWSALLAGIALAGFAAFAWLAVRDAKIRQVESEVGLLAEREAHRPQPPDNWQRFEEMLALNQLHARDPTQVLLLAEDTDGRLIYRSAHWPSGVEPAQFQWPALPRMPIDGPPENTEPGFQRPPESPRDNDGPPSQEPAHDAERSPPRSTHAGPEDAEPGLQRQFRPGGQARRPIPVAVVPLSQRANGKMWKFALAASSRTRIAVAMSTETVDAEMAALRNAFLLALPLALATIALGAWIVSGRALRPVRRLNASLHNVHAKGLDQRIATGGEDREFAELTAGFNSMLERLEKSFHQASRFSGDAAHELRTPLTVLQGQIERAMAEAEPGSAMQERLSGILDETGRLATILRKLLLLSRADAGRLRLQPARIDLSAKLAVMAEDARMMAPHLQIETSIASGLFISADESLLHQLLANLTSNAIKYNVEQGWIKINASRLQGFVVVVFSNASHGIPPAARDKIFERFYRADAAHTRHVDGAGLGLSLAREIARAHGGDLMLGVGSKNEVSLKLVLPGSISQDVPPK